jgi:hypothetical protein
MKQFRIGNLVICNNPNRKEDFGKMFEIVAIDSENSFEHPKNGKYISSLNLKNPKDKFPISFGCWLKYIELVPITDDLLLKKCNFTLIEENSAGKIYAPIIENVAFDDLKIIYFKRENKFFRRSIEIKSLHQLQNLYFALTETELNFEI